MVDVIMNLSERRMGASSCICSLGFIPRFGTCLEEGGDGTLFGLDGENLFGDVVYCEVPDLEAKFCWEVAEERELLRRNLWGGDAVYGCT